MKKRSLKILLHFLEENDACIHVIRIEYIKTIFYQKSERNIKLIHIKLIHIKLMIHIDVNINKYNRYKY